MTKKVLVISILIAITIGGCHVSLTPDYNNIKEIVNNLKSVPHPNDKKVTIVWSGLPQDLPVGMDGINIYITDNPDFDNLSGDDAAVKNALQNENPIKVNDSLTIENMENGKEYFYQIRPVVNGDVLDDGSELNPFYTRPEGEISLDINNGDTLYFYFDRGNGNCITGNIKDLPANESKVDIILSVENEKFILIDPFTINNTLNHTLFKNTQSNIDDWYKTIHPDSNKTNYSAQEELIRGEISSFITHDNHYSKISILLNSKTLSTHSAISFRYAFQTDPGACGY